MPSYTKYLVIPRPCLSCGELYYPRKNESRSNWIKRRFCSRSCARVKQ